MSEPHGQLRKEHLTFPGCSHFRRLDDNHEKCQSCMYGGAPGCTRLSRCHFCADWTSSMWDAEERNRQAAVKRRIRKKDKKASASSTGEPTRPCYESSSEVFPSRNPSPAHSRTSGYSGKGSSPKVHSRDETRVVMALTRIGLSVFALHPRPLVMRYGWSGLAPRHQCAMKGWSLLALLQFHVVVVPRGWHSPWLRWERPIWRWLHWVWWIPQGVFRIQSWTEMWWWRVVGFATSPSAHTTPVR